MKKRFSCLLLFGPVFLLASCGKPGDSASQAKAMYADTAATIYAASLM